MSSNTPCAIIVGDSTLSHEASRRCFSSCALNVASTASSRSATCLIALRLQQRELAHPFPADVAAGRMILQELPELPAALHGRLLRGGARLHGRLDARRHRIRTAISRFTHDGPTTANSSQMPARISALAGALRPRALTTSAMPCQIAP